MDFIQIKGYNSGSTKARRTKLDVHHIIIVILIQYKFHEIPLSGYIVMAPDGRTWTNLYPSAFGGGIKTSSTGANTWLSGFWGCSDKQAVTGQLQRQCNLLSHEIFINL